MTATRLAISLDPELARQIRKSAKKTSISAWLADAAAIKLRSEGLRAVVEDWEREHGKITDEEMRVHRQVLERARAKARKRRS